MTKNNHEWKGERVLFPAWRALRHRRVQFGSVLILALIVLVGGALQSASAQDKVGLGVREALRMAGEAHVMIALKQSPSLKAPVWSKLANVRSEVANMQADVLANLYASEYRMRHQYQAVPALAGMVTETGLDKLVANPNVLKIDLDVGGSGGLANSVPLINADLRHLLGNTGSGVVVAVLDSGLDTDHDDLVDNLVREECFLDNDGTIDGNGLCPNGSDRQTGAGAAEDDAGHGTHVTGIITSNGTQSSIGVAPDADIVAIKVTAGPTFAGVFFFFSEIVAALDFIINNPQLGVEVINMSLGTSALFTGDCDNSTAFNMAGAAAINTLRANGVIAFASAGNNSSGTQMTSPACLSNVVSVGATDNLDNVWVGSNSNASTDIFAPGVNIVSDALSNGTTTASGTSMASPHAAGCAALLIGAGDAVTPAQIEARLETSPVTVVDPNNGLSFPRIDCSPDVNTPPICDANGPYLAECGLDLELDGSGSLDPDGDPLTFTWTGPFSGATANGETPTVQFPSPTGAKSVELEVDDGTDTSQCTAAVTVQDTLPPSLMAPADVTAECQSPDGTAVSLGTPAVSDICDASVDVGNDALPLFPLGNSTVIWTATDDDGNQATDTQAVTVEDTLPPVITCGNPPTIVPPDAPIAFTAIAADQCQGPVTPVITSFDCFKFTKKGKRVDKTQSCVVSIAGDTITIVDSGGVGDNIEWTVEATDASGNTETEVCSLVVANPSSS